MSLTSAFEMGLIRPVIQEIADSLAGGISVSIIPENREPFINLPGLRGYWPMSIAKYTGEAIDHSGASSDLIRVGAPQFGYDGNGYVQVGAANDFLQGFSTQQQITGVETWIEPAIRGMTFGCWVNVNTAVLTSQGLITKFYTAPQISYALYFVNGGACRLAVSSNGTVVFTVDTLPLGVDTWIFVVGRFMPSTELAIFANDVKDTNTTSIPASIKTGTSLFEIGRRSGNNANILHGKIRDAFLCQTALTDVQIENLRESSLPNT